MNQEIVNLVNNLNNPTFSNLNIISWGSPVLSFGNINFSKIATLGLNPSNREFVDEDGNELKGDQRRFHTLDSLGIKKWSEAKEEHFKKILQVCDEYFSRNPYDTWFKQLDYLMSGTSISYYFPSQQACHLDLIPYATDCKWTELTVEQRDTLLNISGNTLGILLKKSSVKLLILNGQTVVDNLERITKVELYKRQIPAWTLPRKTNEGVNGYAYTGTINCVGDIDLNREIKILGFNHNIQSSFGVTSNVKKAIRNWIAEQTKEIL